MAQIAMDGTNGPDRLDGSGSADTLVIRGFDGDDTLYGGLKGDRIAGGDGHNVLYGGDGNDGFFISPIEYNTIYGGNGTDLIAIQLTVEQYATPEIRAALSQLDYFMAKQPADPTTVFVNEALHLEMSGIEQALVRVDATINPVASLVPGAFAVIFQNDTASYLGTDYTLGSRWVVDGANFVRGETFATVERAWHIIGSADFNGDLKADVLWQHETTGAISVWTMDGDTFLSGSTVLTPEAGAGWEVFGTGDFTGDGRAEILMARTVTDPGTGLAYADLSLLTLEADGQTLISGTGIVKASSGWSVAGIGDFDGDGKSDLLWHDGFGNIAVWEMNGADFLRGDTVSNIDPAWTVLGTGDFDGDGRSDILWRNTNGAVSIWEMNGLLVKAAATIYSGGPEWLVAGIGDHNGDGKSDILWRHAPVAGTDVTELQVWTMDGLTVAAAGTLAYLSNDWQTV
jgi:hypothetical protein